MGVDAGTLRGWLENYDQDNITIGVVASHSSLQILHGAKMEVVLHGLAVIKGML